MAHVTAPHCWGLELLNQDANHIDKDDDVDLVEQTQNNKHSIKLKMDSCVRFS